MSKQQSWTFLLSILPNLFKPEDRDKLIQDSPLRFASKEDALAFGKKVFEPPLSVVKWTIVSSQDTPNFPFKK